jgi:hypothetical protein
VKRYFGQVITITNRAFLVRQNMTCDFISWSEQKFSRKLMDCKGEREQDVSWFIVHALSYTRYYPKAKSSLTHTAPCIQGKGKMHGYQAAIRCVLKLSRRRSVQGMNQGGGGPLDAPSSLFGTRKGKREGSDFRFTAGRDT